MQADKPSGSPPKRCLNCGLACKGAFCCEWCMDTYLARQDAHRVARRRRARAQPNEDSAPGAGKAATGG